MNEAIEKQSTEEDVIHWINGAYLQQPFKMEPDAQIVRAHFEASVLVIDEVKIRSASIVNA